jgi:Adenylosuccinate synthetase
VRYRVRSSPLKLGIHCLRFSDSPTFSSKAARTGLMLADALDEDVLDAKLRRLADGYKKRFGDLLQYDVEEELSRLKVFEADPFPPSSNSDLVKDPTC